MVSLSTTPSAGQTSGGAQFLTSDSVEDDHQELLTSQPQSLQSMEEPGYHKIAVTPIIVIHIIISIAKTAVMFLLPFHNFCSEKSCHWKTFCIQIGVHVGAWTLSVILDQYLQRQHEIIRNYGYLEFHRQTRMLRKAPLFIYSVSTVMLLVTVTILWQYLPTLTSTSIPLKPVNYIQIIAGCEMLILLPFLVKYLVKTVNFNRARQVPDVQQDELMSSFMQPKQYCVGDIGFKDETYIDRLVEKQADAIYYLRQHNVRLGRKIVQLTAQLNGKEDRQGQRC